MRPLALIATLSSTVAFAVFVVVLVSSYVHVSRDFLATWIDLFLPAALGIMLLWAARHLNRHLDRSVNKIEAIATRREQYTKDRETSSLVRLMTQAVFSCDQMSGDISRAGPGNAKPAVDPQAVSRLLSHMIAVRASIINTRLLAPDEATPLLQIDDIINILAFDEIGLVKLAYIRKSLNDVLDDVIPPKDSTGS